MHVDDFARATAFSAWLSNALAGELLPWAAGTAVLDRRAPDIWDLNYLRLERPWAGNPATFVETVEEASKAFGLRTPVVSVSSEPQAERLGPVLSDAGYLRDGIVYMTAGADAGRPAGGIDVQEQRYREVLPDRRAHVELPWRSDVDPPTPSLVDQALAMDARLPEVLDDRWFVVRDNGDVVAMCRLLSREGVGQVEDVSTLPQHRNQGYARAVVASAVLASREAGHDLTFISAHEHDWPRQLYAKLGFELVGTVSRFRRGP
jgi:GNAT superfamily N-acetyltransferase